MRKISIFFLALAMVFSMFSCMSKEPVYFNPIFSYYEKGEIVGLNPPRGLEPTAEQLSTCRQIFDNLCEYYGITKEMPTVRVLTEDQIRNLFGNEGALLTLAFYNKGILYISNSTDSAVIAHELCHYLSDLDVNDVYLGAMYEYDDIIVGYALNEALANYFSTQLYPHSSELSIYEYETHVGKVLSTIFGEENLRNAFFNANIDELKEDFNTYVTEYYESSFTVTDTDIVLSPFDAFACCLSTYTEASAIFMSYLDAECYYVFIAEAQTVEEMLLFYAKGKGCERNVIKIIKDFEHHPMLAFEFDLLY